MREQHLSASAPTPYREWLAKLRHMKERFHHRAAHGPLSHTVCAVRPLCEDRPSAHWLLRSVTLSSVFQTERRKLITAVRHVIHSVTSPWQRSGPWVSFPSEPAHLPQSKLYPHINFAAFTHCWVVSHISNSGFLKYRVNTTIIKSWYSRLTGLTSY